MEHPLFVDDFPSETIGSSYLRFPRVCDLELCREKVNISQHEDTPVISLYCIAHWMVCSVLFTHTHLEVVAEYDQSCYEHSTYEAGLAQNHLLYRLESKDKPALQIHLHLPSHSPTSSRTSGGPGAQRFATRQIGEKQCASNEARAGM